MDPARALLVAALITVPLYAVPGLRLLGRPLVLIATLFHELGHGLAALLAGGSFRRLQLWSNGAGMAEYAGRFGRLARAFVSAGGPLGPPLAALLLFWTATEPRRAHLALAVLAGVLGLAALLWLRNLFGFVFTVLLAAALGALAWFGDAAAAQLACAFLAVQLSLSVFAHADYLFKAQARTPGGTIPSDTAQIGAALGLPHWFWGGLIALLALAILGYGLWLCSGAWLAGWWRGLSGWNAI